MATNLLRPPVVRCLSEAKTPNHRYLSGAKTSNHMCLSGAGDLAVLKYLE